ncbi:MAG TPA: NADH-quinone oxidoreductase subunit N, partial [Verrucomicrobiae bacterium]
PTLSSGGGEGDEVSRRVGFRRPSWPSNSSHVGEYFALLLLASIGLLLLVSSEDILLIFLSLELTSLSLYVLTAFDKRSLESSEAGLKYFLFGGMSAAFILFGLSLLYGISGSTNLREIAAAIHGPRLDPLLLLALVMVLVGLGFKVAAAPFHLWAPDVYQGAPVPSAAFIASGSKVAGFFVLAQVMLVGFKGAEGSMAWGAFRPGWVAVLALIAGLSMVVGNLAALVQTSVRRLLAYSAIAHAGYLLLAVIGANQQTLPALVYYALTYAVTALGAFGVVGVISGRNRGDRISDFAGLSRREPVLALCMAVFLLSLAGIPPLAGFFGKFYVFSSALRGPVGLALVWLVALALGMSAVSLYYYLKVLKAIYVADLPADALPTPAPAPTLMLVLMILMAGATLVLGSAPDLLLRFLAATT